MAQRHAHYWLVFWLTHLVWRALKSEGINWEIYPVESKQRRTKILKPCWNAGGNGGSSSLSKRHLGFRLRLRKTYQVLKYSTSVSYQTPNGKCSCKYCRDLHDWATLWWNKCRINLWVVLKTGSGKRRNKLGCPLMFGKSENFERKRPRGERFVAESCWLNAFSTLWTQKVYYSDWVDASPE